MGLLGVSILFMLLAVWQCEVGATPKILGPGRMEADRGEFPYFAFVRRKSDPRGMTGGVLIKPRVVLASGFSFIGNSDTSDIIVILGTHNRSRIERTRQEYNLTSITFNVDRNLALIQLAEPVEINRRVQVFPVRDISRSLREDNRAARFSNCTVCGYGYIKLTLFETIRPRTLQKFRAEVRSSRVCRAFTINQFNYTLPRGEMCSVNDDLTIAATEDYGSPLICTDGEGELTLHGIVSYSSFPFRLGFNVYDRLSAYRNWIIETARTLA